MQQWQLQDAKARFSELVRKAETEGPQEITVRGKAACVLISVEAYERLLGEAPDLATLIRKSPLAGTSLKVKRDRSASRDIPF